MDSISARTAGPSYSIYLTLRCNLKARISSMLVMIKRGINVCGNL
jgi:hypothetical protein